MSEIMDRLFSALVKAQGEFPKISLDSTVKVKTNSGAEYSFRYSSLPNILELVKPILTKNELAITQGLDSTPPETFLITTLIHSSGQSISTHCTLPFEPKPAFKAGEQPKPLTMQERGSVISYFRRYCISCMLGIVGEEDDDANTADGNAMERKQTKPPNKPLEKPRANPQSPSASAKPAPAPQDRPQEDKLPFPTSEPPAPEPIDTDALKQAIEQCKSVAILKEWGLDYKTNVKSRLKPDEQTEITVAYKKQKEILEGK